MQNKNFVHNFSSGSDTTHFNPNKINLITIGTSRLEFSVKNKTLKWDNNQFMSPWLLQKNNFNNIEEIPLSIKNWLVGFSDAESNFQISINLRNSIVFKYTINLHIDDADTLYFIRDVLNVGTVRLLPEYNKVRFQVNKHEEIKNIIIPLFDQIPLLTTKALDFEDFKKAFILKDSNSLKDRAQIIPEIIALKNKMNKKRVLEDNLLKDSSMDINLHWLLGFIEGEGSFELSSGNALISLGQLSTNSALLEAISLFVQKLTLSIKGPRPVTTFGEQESMSRIRWSNLEELIILLNIFGKEGFVSRKRVDFMIWCHGINILYGGYHTLDEGLKLYQDLVKNINKKRYTTSLTYKDLPLIDQATIDNLFLQPDPYPEVLTSKQKKSSIHTKIELDKKNRVIEVLDLNNNLLFTCRTYTEAGKFCNCSYKTIVKYINLKEPFNNYILKEYSLEKRD